MGSVHTPKRLPPLNALRTFEAAGRLQSIRQAAAELNVTPGAVSRQVQVLESWLGVPLFEHGSHSVTLTKTGAHYLGAVTAHLGALAEATAEITNRERGESVLLIRSYTFFATNWLVPRLTEFYGAQPWVDLQLVTSSMPGDFGHHDADAEIRPSTRISAKGPEDWPGFRADPLISDEIVCVCSPDYRAGHGLDRPEDLPRLGAAKLLRSIASPDLWQEWLAAVGIPDLAPEFGPAYGDSVLTCRAAAAGQGVALAPLSLVETDLAGGRLVIAFPSSDRYHIAFYLVYAPERATSPAFTTFRKWLLAQTSTQ